MSNKNPSREECFGLLKKHQTPEHVIRHSVKVTETALKIGSALNQNGLNLDLELIQAAGLLHDIARVEDKHWDIGADIALSLGYQALADIIRAHMFFNTNLDDDIKEIDIICLADRTVKEDEYVGLEARMKYVLDKFQDNPEALKRITERIENNKHFIVKIETLIHQSIDSLM